MRVLLLKFFILNAALAVVGCGANGLDIGQAGGNEPDETDEVGGSSVASSSHRGGSGGGSAGSSTSGKGGAEKPSSDPDGKGGRATGEGGGLGIGGTGPSGAGGARPGGVGGRGGPTTGTGGGGPGLGRGGAGPGRGSGGSGPVLGRGGSGPGTGAGGAGPGVGVGGGGPAAGGAGPGPGVGGSGPGTGGSPAPAKKFVGNITTGDSVDTDGKVFAKYWDQITPENAGKWGSVQSNAGASFNWRTLDAIYQYTETNKIIFKQHTFIWGAQQPGGSISEANVKSWMTEFCKRYPNTKLIDVVNEPPPHTTPSYANSIGGGTNGSWQWVINAFKWAREACPNAILIFNDYNNIEWSNDATNFIGIAKKALAGGAPIDAIGAQSHDLDHASITSSTVKSLLEKLHTETGLPIYITEFDISTTDDNAQLNAYKDYIPHFMETEWVHGITIWGWIYGKTWSQAPQSGLIRNGSPRPAMTWLMQQLGRPAP